MNDLEKREREKNKNKNKNKPKNPSNIRKQRFKIKTWITLVSETVVFLVISGSSKFNLD